MLVVFHAGTVLRAPAISFSVDAVRFHSDRISGTAPKRHTCQTGLAAQFEIYGRATHSITSRDRAWPSPPKRGDWFGRALLALALYTPRPIRGWGDIDTHQIYSCKGVIDLDDAKGRAQGAARVY